MILILIVFFGIALACFDPSWWFECPLVPNT